MPRIELPLLILLTSWLAAEDLAELRTRWERGEHASVVAELERLVADDPANTEAASLLGQYLGFTGRSAEGERLLRDAVRREPANADHHLRLALVLRRAGRRDEALAEAERACVLAPDYLDAVRLRDDLRQPPIIEPADVGESLLWRLDVGGMIDHYTRLRDTENEEFVALARRLASGISLGVGINQQHRYGEDDQRYEASLYSPLDLTAEGWLRVGWSPGNQFLADHEEEAGALLRLPEDVRLGGRVLYRSFPDEHLLMPRAAIGWNTEGRLGVEVAYQLTFSDEQRTTGAVEIRAYWLLNDHHSGWLGYSHGDENNPPLPISAVDTVFAVWDWRLTHTLTLRLHGSYEHREDLYERFGAGANAMVRF